MAKSKGFQAKVNKEKKKLSEVFNQSKSQEIISRLIDRASFLLVMAQEMEDEIKELCNYTLETTNASQHFIKANPLLKDYRDTVKSYQTVLKQLTDLTKNDLKPEDEDPLKDFLFKE